MFYILAIALCLAVMFLVIACASLLCMPSARLLLNMVRSVAPGIKANLLFAARLLPLGSGLHCDIRAGAASLSGI